MLSEEQKSSYREAKILNEITSDPKTNPYKSKYESRKILDRLRDEIHQQCNEDASNQELRLVCFIHLFKAYIILDVLLLLVST